MSPLSIIDRDIVEINTGTSGNAFIACNLNGRPGTEDEQGMVVSGNPDVPTIGYDFSFSKFRGGKLERLYEQCRCVWWKMQWVPTIPNDSSTTNLYAPVCVLKERDGGDWSPTSTFPSDRQIYSEPRMKVYNAYRPFTIFQRTVPYGYLSKVPPYNTATVYSNTGANIMGQWHGIGTGLGRLDDVNGFHIYVRFKEFSASKKLGHFIITARMQCKENYNVAES